MASFGAEAWLVSLQNLHARFGSTLRLFVSFGGLDLGAVKRLAR